MAFTIISGPRGITSFIGTSGVDLVLIRDRNSLVFADGLGDSDVIDFTDSRGTVSEYTLQGGDGDDAIRSIATSSARSFFHGNSGVDTITLDRLSQSTVLGGEGGDLISIDTVFESSINGNQGIDLINAFSGATSSLLLGGKDNDDFLLGGLFSVAEIRGGADNDLIQIFRGAELNNSTINGNAGNDVIRLLGDVKLSSSSISGGAGNDELNGSASNLPVIFFGGAGNDSLTGGNSTDDLNGGGGDDLIVGRSAADSLLGGAGSDTFSYSAGIEGELQTGDVTTGLIDQIIDFTTSLDKLKGFGVGGTGQFASFAGGFSSYETARLGITGQIALAGYDYVVTSYGSGNSWTAVLFTDILNSSLDPFSPSGAIQIRASGQFSTEAQAIASIAASDILA